MNKQVIPHKPNGSNTNNSNRPSSQPPLPSSNSVEEMNSMITSDKKRIITSNITNTDTLRLPYL